MDQPRGPDDVIDSDANSNIVRDGSHTAMTPLEDIQHAKRLTFNVGGVVFETYERDFSITTSRTFKLADKCFMARHYDTNRKEYFFDRDPEVFRSVLNYWRTGSLHLPPSMCGPQLKAELDYWGLKELDIEPCCWNNYHNWMKTMASLHRLENDRRPSYLYPKETRPLAQLTWCERGLHTVWKILTDPSYSRASKIYAYISLFFVIFSIFSFCASTHRNFQIEVTIQKTNSSTNNSSNVTSRSSGNYEVQDDLDSHERKVHPVLFYIDMVCLAYFTAEYILRFVCASKRFRFIISLSSIIDILAVLPDYVDLWLRSFHPSEEAHALVNFMPFLRLMRAFRIFRLIRRVPGLWIMLYTLKASFKELSLMLIFLLVGTLFFSSVIFFVEDPLVFHSIPQGFWWAIVTMTTVGYGDIAPTTAWGKLIGSVTAICGVLIVGFTIPALVNNFITYYQHVEFVMQKESLLLAEQKEKEEQDSEAAKKESVVPLIENGDTNGDEPEERYRGHHSERYLQFNMKPTDL